MQAYYASKIFCQNGNCPGALAGSAFVNPNPTSLKFCYCKDCGTPFEFSDPLIIQKLMSTKGKNGGGKQGGGKGGKGGKGHFGQYGKGKGDFGKNQQSPKGRPKGGKSKDDSSGKNGNGNGIIGSMLDKANSSGGQDVKTALDFLVQANISQALKSECEQQLTAIRPTNEKHPKVILHECKQKVQAKRNKLSKLNEEVESCAEKLRDAIDRRKKEHGELLELQKSCELAAVEAKKAIDKELSESNCPLKMSQVGPKETLLGQKDDLKEDKPSERITEVHDSDDEAKVETTIGFEARQPSGSAGSSQDNAYDKLHAMITQTNAQVVEIMEKLNAFAFLTTQNASGGMDWEKSKQTRKLSGDDNPKNARRRQ